jgi:TolB protein
MRIPGARVAATTALVLAGAAGPAQATVPGENGRIAFASFTNRLDELTLRETMTRSIDVASPTGRGRRSLRSCTRVVGENGVQVAPDRGDCSIEYGAPAWSPTGARLAFDAGTRLALIRADGKQFRLLPGHTADDGEPAWSPDGRRLVFSGAPNGTARSELYLLELRSGEVHQLTFTGGREPDWSTRGLIAFTRGGDASRPGSGRIFTVRPNGRGLRRVSGGHGSDPAWSPHGTKLVFVRGRQRAGGWAYSLFEVAADGRGLRSVRTPGADDPANPSWSPDGKRIAYSTFDECVFAQRLDGRDAREVASCGTGGAYRFGGSAPSWQARR